MDNFESAKKSFFEGLRLLEANNYQGAENQFTRALELIPDRVSTLNNLATVKIRLNKLAEAEELARRAVEASSNSPEAWTNLGIALGTRGLWEEALQACDRALEYNPGSTETWLTKATNLRELGRFAEALLACDQGLKFEPAKYELLHARSLILNDLGRQDEAQKNYQQALNARVSRSPVLLGERRATQNTEVLIISRNPDREDSFKSFETMLRHCENYPGQLAKHLVDRFHFTYAFVAGAGDPAARLQIPQPDLVINNDVNGELILARKNLPELAKLLESFGVPVVNHPLKAIQTTRDNSVKMLEGIPGVLVPKTARFSATGKSHGELVREIEDQFDYPVITRSLNMQKGKGMTKVDSRDVLLTTLAGDLPENFFVTKFYETRGGDRFYRKLRAAIAHDETVIVRVDYKDDWNVHGRTTEERANFYLSNAYLLEEEKRICQDPESYLGRPAIQALQAVRERIPMDVFGIDFGVDADGQVVFYEANATMNLFSTAKKQVPNPKEAEDRFKEALIRYFISLSGRGTIQ